MSYIIDGLDWAQIIKDMNNPSTPPIVRTSIGATFMNGNNEYPRDYNPFVGVEEEEDRYQAQKEHEMIYGSGWRYK